MLRINQLKLKVNHDETEFKEKIRKTLRIREEMLLSYTIKKRSLDARKKPELFYVYTVDVQVQSERQILKNKKLKNVSLAPEGEYHLPESGCEELTSRPVIIGSGPAGLFCAYMLSLCGYRPILLERGKRVDERIRDVELFWETGTLDPGSNVQFGEGGAGTFSDGKLNTLVKDTWGRNQKVLRIFVECGAPEEILYEAKPHIGTDILAQVVKNMREKIIANGGEVRFQSQVTGVEQSAGKLTGLHVTDESGTSVIPTQAAVFAIGHSARDTFHMLYERGVPMEAKSFAVGVRVEHLQEMINESQYGQKHPKGLSAAPYKLAVTLDNQRGVYTFCMCPGGYVVNASSEEQRVAVNGMSYHKRDGKNANSAVIVTVTPDDYGKNHPLAGVAFQRKLEEKAFMIGKGTIPVQLLKDFMANRASESLGKITPQTKGAYTLANVREIFPEDIASSIQEGMIAFDRKIPGFAGEEVLLSGVESRTSSPVRILRDDQGESAVKGIYPCGEGAGYAGGITSAAMDGIKTAEILIHRFRPV